MENRLLPDEEVAFINQKVTEFSNRRSKSFTRRCFILTAFVLFTVALTVLAIALIRHVELDRTRANEISTASFERCGNQSTKACIQDKECTLSRTRRLVNGKIARKDSWPWMAEIVYSEKHYCGAVLISPNVVITAAHCLYHHESKLYEQDIEIRIGSRRKLSTDENTQIFKASTIHIHHDFELSSLKNDIAVIVLTQSAVLTESVWPICLASSPRRLDLNSNGIMAGWGKTSHTGEFSSVLRESAVPIVSLSQCAKTNGNLFPGVTVSPTHHICVGYGKDRADYGCNGDSGGPLMVQSSSGLWLLVGIMSWGEPKCSSQKTNSFTVFTNTLPYVNWIGNTIKESR